MSHDPIPYSKPLYIYVCIYYGFYSLENPDTDGVRGELEKKGREREIEVNSEKNVKTNIR